jgi:carboxypeptidase D
MCAGTPSYAPVLTIELQGGPGCSSFDGLMMEVGPWRMDGKGGFNTAEGGWEEYTTMVYGVSTAYDILYALIHFLQWISPLARVSRIRARIDTFTLWRRRVPVLVLTILSDGELQASTQFIEFARNFYKVFPEYQHMDVCRVPLSFVREAYGSFRPTLAAKVMRGSGFPILVRIAHINRDSH